MKKTVRNLFGILGCTVLLTGCVQLPPVPDAMKVSTYNNTASTGNSNNRYTNVANLTGDEKLSCEYMYCMAHIDNKNMASDKDCKASKNRLETILNKYSDFSTEQNQARRDFIRLCPHTNVSISPFN